MDNVNEIVRRRFGSKYSNPCNDPNVVECAIWSCQKAGFCQKGRLEGTGFQVIALSRPEQVAERDGKEARE